MEFNELYSMIKSAARKEISLEKDCRHLLLTNPEHEKVKEYLKWKERRENLRGALRETFEEKYAALVQEWVPQKPVERDPLPTKEEIQKNIEEDKDLYSVSGFIQCVAPILILIILGVFSIVFIAAIIAGCH